LPSTITALVDCVPLSIPIKSVFMGRLFNYEPRACHAEAVWLVVSGLCSTCIQR
jgi:hypothetical protein